MKKFISFVMAGAMIASLVPATAFAKGDVSATAKVIDALEKDKTFDGKINGSTVSDIPELQLKVTSASYQESTSTTPEMDVTVTLDNADFDKDKFDVTKNLGIRLDDSADADANNQAIATTKKAYEDAQAAEAIAQKAYDDAVAAASVTVPKTAALTAAEVAYTPGTPEAGSTVTDLTAAQGNVTTAQNGVTTAQGNVDSAYATYVANPTTPNETAWTDAKDALKLAQDALTAAEAALATAQTNYDDAVTAYTTAKAEYDAIVADALKNVVKTEFDALTTAKADTVAAKKAYDEAVAGAGNGVVTFKDVKFTDTDELEFTIVGKLNKDDVIFLDMVTIMDKTSEGKKATVSVDSKMVKSDDLTFASVLSKGLKVSIRKTVDVATDEVVTLNSNGLKIETSVGEFKKDQVIKLKLNSGFEFVKGHVGTAGTDADVSWVDDKEIELKITAAGDGKDEITLKDTQIEATTAKSGAVASITARSNNMDSASCEVAKVVDYKVNLTVDADEDLPVIYSGVNVENDGITDDSDHLSLEVTAKESFPGAWSMRQGFNFNLPEGVYVTDVKVNGADNFKIIRDGKKETEGANKSDWEVAFKNAYQDGDHKNFEFKKRVFNDVDTILDKDPAELTFQLELVADPTFEGDVKLAFEGALVDKQEVTIAKFVKPYTVKAEQNDVIIDYRNTEVKTPIVITEAEEGLWKKDTTFKLKIEDDLLDFEDDPTFTIDSDSDLKLKDDKTTKGTIQFAVKEESDKAASVTISDMKLFMSRSIPAGAYDLEIATTMSEAYDREKLYAPDEETKTVTDWESGDRPKESDVKKDSYVDDVCDYSDVVKAAFINVVTSGRDNDNLFTTKVVVPVGEAYLLAGEAKVELDAPAYISAAGYTMLPVRAISKALGVNTNNVLWNAETRTVTVMYAQRIITMTVGQKSVYVNGSPIPTSAAPEIKDGRTFLPLRDLGTALGVTNVNWDAATKTATLN